MITLITGITGQDGSYLAEFLLTKNYEVWGIIRRSSSINTNRIEHIRNKLNLRYGDLTDSISLNNIITEITQSKKFLESDCYLEVYNLAAQSHVKVSFEVPTYTAQTDAVGTLNLLETIKNNPHSKRIKLYQASTSELYGKVQQIPQNENTPFYPRSPYGVAKLYSYWITKNYREAYDMFICNGILFNHESPRRGYNFITRKITLGVNNYIKKGEILYVGNIDSKRDWGHAKDYIEGMWLMLQQKHLDDFVLATGENHTVREFIEKAFKIKNIIISWKGEGVNEVGYDQYNREVVKISEKYFRPTEIDELLGDASYANVFLNWEPKISFDELIKEMVENDCK